MDELLLTNLTHRVGDKVQIFNFCKGIDFTLAGVTF